MVNPLPVKLIQDFASQVSEVIVVEELDGIIEAHCNSIGVKVKGKELFGNIDELICSLLDNWVTSLGICRYHYVLGCILFVRLDRYVDPLAELNYRL